MHTTENSVRWREIIGYQATGGANITHPTTPANLCIKHMVSGDACREPFFLWEMSFWGRGGGASRLFDRDYDTDGYIRTKNTLPSSKKKFANQTYGSNLK